LTYAQEFERYILNRKSGFLALKHRRRETGQHFANLALLGRISYRKATLQTGLLGLSVCPVSFR